MKPFGVERLANVGDLPVHHPARGDDGGSGAGLGDGDLGVDLQGGVVVDAAAGVEHAAVAMIGVLVDAQIGDQHDLVADVVAQVGEGELGDAVGVEGRTAGGVLVRRHAEQHDSLDAEAGELGDLLAQAFPGVLHDAGQRRDGQRLVDPLAHEQRSDQVGSAHRRLGDELAQRRGRAQAAQSGDRKVSHRTHRTGSTPTTAATMASSVGASATAATGRPWAAATSAVRRPIVTIAAVTRDRCPCSRDRLRPRLHRRAAGQHDGVGAGKQAELRGVGRERSGDVGLDGDDVVAGGPQSGSEVLAGAVGLGQEHPGRRRRERGEQTVAVGLLRNEVDGATGPPSECRRRGQPDRGEPDVRDAGGGVADRRGPVGRGDHQPVERRRARRARRAAPAPPSVGGPMAISGTCSTRGPGCGEASGEASPGTDGSRRRFVRRAARRCATSRADGGPRPSGHGGGERRGAVQRRPARRPSPGTPSAPVRSPARKACSSPSTQ